MSKANQNERMTAFLNLTFLLNKFGEMLLTLPVPILHKNKKLT